MLGIITIDDAAGRGRSARARDIHKLGGLEALDVPYAEAGFGP
jgi:Mg/Co/Ni transporter MgtE